MVQLRVTTVMKYPSFLKQFSCYCSYRVARNQKVNTNNESTRTEEKKERIAKGKTKIKRDENRDIEKAKKGRTEEEVGTKKVTRKRSIVASTLGRKVKREYRMA